LLLTKAIKGRLGKSKKRQTVDLSRQNICNFSEKSQKSNELPSPTWQPTQLHPLGLPGLEAGLLQLWPGTHQPELSYRWVICPDWKKSVFLDIEMVLLMIEPRLPIEPCQTQSKNEYNMIIPTLSSCQSPIPRPRKTGKQVPVQLVQQLSSPIAHVWFPTTRTHHPIFMKSIKFSALPPAKAPSALFFASMALSPPCFLALALCLLPALPDEVFDIESLTCSVKLAL